MSRLYHDRELRLACLGLANVLAASKNIGARQVVEQAAAYVKFIEGEGDDAGASLSEMRAMQTVDKNPDHGGA